MQVLPREQSFGSELGTGLGQLAGLKLGQLVKRHEQAKERSHFAQTWEPILGKDSANFLSNLQPEERKHALQNISALVQLNQPPSSQEQAGELGQKNGLGALAEQQQKKLTPQRAKSIEDIFISPQEKREREKLELAKRTAGLRERQSAVKETKEYVDTLKNKEKASKEADLRLKRMETIINKGNLPNSALWSALSKLEHAPYFSGLTGPIAELVKGGVKLFSLSPLERASDIEEFEKLSSEFVKNAKQYFGPRVTQQEIQLYMQTVPTLAQSDRGKRKLIENIRSLNELAEIEAKAARSIIKANGGTAPVDIEQQVQDKVSDKIDKVAKKFIER